MTILRNERWILVSTSITKSCSTIQFFELKDEYLTQLVSSLRSHISAVKFSVQVSLCGRFPACQNFQTSQILRSKPKSISKQIRIETRIETESILFRTIES
ncbi:hypothetical protein PM082_004193 [Marasmius tenuissimus]|nr:hypothetical protein PM082_004193 [Marasmius tenuissimus]